MPKMFRNTDGKHISTTHGMSNDRFYIIFKSMEQRCKDKNAYNYHLYGGRGIKNEWESFEQFYLDMHKSYQGHLREFGAINTSIERIDNDKNYCRENCKWATRQEQANNRRTNYYIEYNGIRKSMAEWARETGMGYTLIKKRVIRGWTPEKIFTSPRSDKHRNKLTVMAQTATAG